VRSDVDEEEQEVSEADNQHEYAENLILKGGESEKPHNS
jgi:hypothetical protein